MAKKIIKLTESDLHKIVKKIIQEQRKTIDIIFPGKNAEAEIMTDRKGKKLIVRTEIGTKQEMYVTTALPNGKFMFERGKDGKRMFGYESKTGKKFEIFPANVR